MTNECSAFSWNNQQKPLSDTKKHPSHASLKRKDEREVAPVKLHIPRPGTYRL